MAVELVIVPPWGELRRESGFALVKKIDMPQRGQRNAHIELNAEHLGDPVSGWVDTTDADIWRATVAAFDRGQRVFYVVETHRKDSVDVDVPFAELAKDQKVRDVREITAVNGNGVPLDGLTEDRAPGESTPPEVTPPTPTPPPRATPPAASHAVAVLGLTMLIEHDPEKLNEKRLRTLTRRLTIAFDMAQAETGASVELVHHALRLAVQLERPPYGASIEEADAWAIIAGQKTTELVQLLTAVEATP